MPLLRLLYLAIGLTLLGWILADVDLGSVWRQVTSVGVIGLGIILAAFAVEFGADVASWQMTFRSVPLRPRWLGRLYLVRMVGEAWNIITPMASIGGEPVKVVLLKKYYGVSYSEASASILLAKTTNLIALVIFLCGGFILLLHDPRFSTAYRSTAAAGLAGFTIAIAGFYLVQRLRVSSKLGVRLSKWRLGARLADALHHVEAFDDRLVDYYVARRRRFLCASTLALCNWFTGALGIYLTMYFLGLPVSFAEAWIIEALAQLVRAGTFFIPASIGAQEGIFVLVCGVLTGDASAGLAAALVRRFRELIWIIVGLLLGWWFSFKPRHAGADLAGGISDATRAAGGQTQPR